MEPDEFHVFLSHRSEDDVAVERIARKLRAAQLEPWIDNWYCQGGGRWQQEIADGLTRSHACAVFFGASGVSDWVDEEIEISLSRTKKDKSFRVFLVLLPGAPEPFDRSKAPAFLNNRGWVDLREGFEQPGQFTKLVNAILGISAVPAPASVVSGVSPYRGLEVFDEDHAQYYFGRSTDVQNLLERLKTSRFLAVIGPSGSGKSSLVRAGLIPALRDGRLPGSGDWIVSKMRPGPHPLDRLGSELVRVAPTLPMGQTIDELARDPRALDHIARFVIGDSVRDNRFLMFVDQFEELFTLCNDEAERSAFIATLLHAATNPGGTCIVVLTMRADFYARCAAYPELAALVSGQQVLIGALDEHNLREIIIEPARLAGLEFEEGLVETMLEDVSDRPGSLPLLEHALQRLWENRNGNQLTLKGYQDSGRVTGSIAQSADSEFDAMTPDQQVLTRQIFLRLTQPGEGTEDTRRRASIDELVTEGVNRERVEQVIDRLIAARLLTADASGLTPDDPQVDVAHEALIRGWPRLRGWIDEDRAGLRVHRRLADDAAEWQRMGFDAAQLYRGSKLLEATEYANLRPSSLNRLETSFLEHGAALRDQERADENARRLARERNRKRVVAGLGAGLIIAMLLAGFGWYQRGNALERSDQRATAEALALAESSNRRAAEITAVAEADRARTAEANANSEAIRAQTAEANANAEAVRAAEAQDVAEANAQTAQAESLIRATAEANSAIEAANALAAQATAQANAELAAAQQQEAERQAQIADQNRKESNARELAAIAASDNVRIDEGLLLGLEAIHTGGDAVDPYLLPRILMRDPRITSVLLPPDPDHALGTNFCMLKDGNVLAALGRDDSIYLWDTNTAKLMHTLGGGAAGPSIYGSISCQEHGTLIASSANPDATIEFWDIDQGRQTGQIDVDARKLSFFGFDAAGDVLAIADPSGIKLWNVAEQRETLPIGIGQQTRPLTPVSAAMSADGRLLAIGNDAGQLQIWNMQTGAIVQGELQMAEDDQAIGQIRFAPSGALIAFAIEGAKLFVLPIGSDAQPTLVKDYTATLGQIIDVAFSPDGRRLAVSTLDGQITLIDLHSSGYPEERSIAPFPEGNGGWGLQFRPDDASVLASLGSDGAITLWDLDAPGIIATSLSQFGIWAAGLAVSPDGRTLAVIDCYGAVSLWDLASLTPLDDIGAGHRTTDCHAFMGIAFSHDGSLLAAGFGDGSVQVLNWRDRTVIHQFDRGGQAIVSVGFSPDDSVVGAVDEVSSVTFWTLAAGDGATPTVLQASNDIITAAAWSPDGRFLVTAAGDGLALKIWDLDLPGQFSELPVAGLARVVVWGVMFEGDSSRIVAVDVLGEVLGWSRNGATWTPELLGDNRQMGIVVAISPLASRSNARLTTMNELGIYGPDSTPRLEVQLQAPNDIGLRLVASPDGTRVISGHSNQIIVWNLDPASWAATACQIAGRNLSADEWDQYFPDQPYHKTCDDYPVGYGVETPATAIAGRAAQA